MNTNELQKPKLSPIAKKMFPVAQDRIDVGKCPLCNAKINGTGDFKDAASTREYEISGLCQECQDKTYG